MIKRAGIIYYRSYVESIRECSTFKETAILTNVLNDLLFMDIEEIDDFEQKSEEIFEKYNEKYKNPKIMNNIKRVLIGLNPNIRKSIERQLNGAKGAPYGKLGGAPKGNKNAQKKQPQNNPYIDMEKEIEIDNEYDIEHVEHETDFSLIESKSSNDDVVDFYGEYKNVGLSKKQYQELLKTCGTQAFLNTIIKALDEDISLGRKDGYKDDYPMAHYILLNRYYRYRKENPEMFSESKSSEIKNNFSDCSYAKAEEMAINQVIKDW